MSPEALRNVLSTRRSAIVEQWLAKTLQTYPEQTRRFLQREQDPFRNPVGEVYRKALPQLYDELAGEMDAVRVTAALEPLVKIGAVQDSPPSRAVAFIFLLKAILREELGKPCPAAFSPGGGEERDKGQKRAEVMEVLESAVDRMALMAFDLFVRCREGIYEIKAEEARNRVYLLERMRSQ